MDKTKIEWAEATWNPVTGCLHGCEYCYARRIAERFSYEGQTLDAPVELQGQWIEDARGLPSGCHVLREKVKLKDGGRIVPYPFAFAPTLHRYRLDEPEHWTKPRTIFVCSMADLFGTWVPVKWIVDVLGACRRAPQHRYLFLTKNPDRYRELDYMALLPHEENFWYGTSVTDDEAAQRPQLMRLDTNTFWSMEPLIASVDMSAAKGCPKWVILGAETGNRRNKVRPRKEWIDSIVDLCDAHSVPVLMKDSLIPIVGAENMRRDFPWKK